MAQFLSVVSQEVQSHRMQEVRPNWQFHLIKSGSGAGHVNLFELTTLSVVYSTLEQLVSVWDQPLD